MVNGLSVENTVNFKRAPYSIWLGIYNAKTNRFDSPEMLITTYSRLPARGGRFYPARNVQNGYEKITIAEYNHDKDNYRLLETLSVRLPMSTKGYPLIYRVCYRNRNSLWVKVYDGTNDKAIFEKEILIRRSGMTVTEADENHVVTACGCPVYEEKSDVTPYAIGFIRMRSNNEKYLNRYSKNEFIPCEPYFEEILAKGTVYGRTVNGFTHVDTGDCGEAILELAEYADDDCTMHSLGKIYLDHFRYSDRAARSSKGSLTVGVILRCIDRNTLEVITMEDGVFRTYETRYIIDIQREILKEDERMEPAHQKSFVGKRDFEKTMWGTLVICLGRDNPDEIEDKS